MELISDTVGSQTIAGTSQSFIPTNRTKVRQPSFSKKLAIQFMAKQNQTIQSDLYQIENETARTNLTAINQNSVQVTNPHLNSIAVPQLEMDLHHLGHTDRDMTRRDQSLIGTSRNEHTITQHSHLRD